MDEFVHCTCAPPRARDTRLRLVAGMATGTRRLVFLGTPAVAARTLERVLAGEAAGSYEVVGVVSQPRRARGRGRRRGGEVEPTPVEAVALRGGFGASGSDRVLMTPESCRSEAFLEQMAGLRPDLCVTAAYGNMLPQGFLDIPRHGTLNVHPSLLPRWRGAAPVQRCIESGDAALGVSLAYTVLACDAGPVLASERVEDDGVTSAPGALEMLFDRGAGMLMRELPAALTGEALGRAVPQDEAGAVHAAKISREEALIDAGASTALQVHNKVRAFAGWPGAVLRVRVGGGGDGLDMKVLEGGLARAAAAGPPGSLATGGTGGGIHVTCADGGVYRIDVVQVPGKKAMRADAFVNGLGGKRLLAACA